MPLVGKRRKSTRPEVGDDTFDPSDRAGSCDRFSTDADQTADESTGTIPESSTSNGPSGRLWNQFAIVGGILSVVVCMHHYGVFSLGKAPRSFVSSFIVSTESPAGKPPAFRAAEVFHPSEAPKSKFKPPPPAESVILPASVGGGTLVSQDITVTSWNLAKPNNPFEYHFGGSASPAEGVLSSFSEYIQTTGDVVESVFTEGYFKELSETMARVAALQPCLASKWQTYRSMKLQDFLHRIEEKRVIKSIESRTNPFLQLRGDAVYRPTAVGCGDNPEDTASLKSWWAQWHKFMFTTEARGKSSSGNIFGLTRQSSCVGVDVLALAIYDAVMLHALEKSGKPWRETRTALCTAIHTESAKKVVAGLKAHHASSDIILLQNVNLRTLEEIRDSEFGKSDFSVKVPSQFESDRRYNSVVLFKTGRFIGIVDVTRDVNFGPDDHGGRVAVFTATRFDKDASKIIVTSASGPADIITRVQDYALFNPPIRSFFAALHKQDAPDASGTAHTPAPPAEDGSSDGSSLSFPSNRHLRVLGKLHTRFYVKSHAQKAFSEGVAPSEKATNGVKAATELLVFSGVHHEAASSSVFLLGGGEGARPTMEHPLISAAIVAQLRPVNPAVPPAKLGQMYDARRKEITDAQSTHPPTPQPPPPPTSAPPRTEVPSARVLQRLETQPPSKMTEVNGSIILPAEGVGEYVNVDVGEMYPAESQVPGAVTVTAVCDNGLGDRLGSLFSAIHLAWTLNARFHLVWNMNNECRARASSLFEFDGSSSSVANRSSLDNLEERIKTKVAAYDAVITLAHHFSTGHLVGFSAGTHTPPVGDAQWLCGEARKVSLAPDGQLVQWARARQRKGLRTHILHHIDRLAQGTDLAGVTKALAHFNFRINPVILQRVDRFCEEHHIHPKNTVGVHLRGTDARIPLRMKDVITDVRINFGGRTFFVASDDKKAEELFLSEFAGRAVKNSMKTHYPSKKDKNADYRIQGKLGAGRFNVERDEASVVDALTDMALLSRTERPIIDGVLRDSSFGKMSTTLCVLRLTCNEELGKVAESVKAPARPGG